MLGIKKSNNNKASCSLVKGQRRHQRIVDRNEKNDLGICQALYFHNALRKDWLRQTSMHSHHCHIMCKVSFGQYTGLFLAEIL